MTFQRFSFNQFQKLLTIWYENNLGVRLRCVVQSIWVQGYAEMVQSIWVQSYVEMVQSYVDKDGE